MLGENKRLFVGNIPQGVSETDLKKEFSAYGSVHTVEIKKKENFVDPNNPTLFAFITLQIDGNSLDLCIDEFSKQKYRGRFLNVSVAKESFLDRLKRERDENEKQKSNQHPTEEDRSHESGGKVSVLPKIEADVDSSSDSSDSSESDNQEGGRSRSPPQNSAPQFESEIFIAKKKASSSLLNGKIKIQSTNTEPIHVITKKGKELKRLDDEAKKSDQKRKASMKKMKNQYNQQKLAIQQALSAVDQKISKKIIFDDEAINGGDTHLDHKKNLFGDDEDDDKKAENYSKDFELKTQFLGKSGEELMKLQSKYKLDPRFKLDTRFLDKNDGKAVDEAHENDERTWQLGIIEEMMGRKIAEPHKKNERKTMLRYDPTQEDHQKFLRNVEEVPDVIATEKEEHMNGEEIEVSKEQFYTVNEDLSKSLRMRGDGFSLLSMFGRHEGADGDDKNEGADKYEERALISNQTTVANPFHFDSSESEDDNAAVEEKPTVPGKENASKKAKTKTATGIRKENFFMFHDDDRFEEGAAFFKKPQGKESEEPEDYEEVRNRLSMIIRKKIEKTKRHTESFKKMKVKLKKK